MRLVVWNTMWASPRSPRGAELQQRILAVGPDLAVLTEVTLPFLQGLGGYHVVSEAAYGYRASPVRRKVALWSSQAFSEEDAVGSAHLPPGRFASATLRSPMGSLRLVGVCIPWSHAHVATGRKDAKPWQEHERYLGGLLPLAQELEVSALIAGDFNQRIPKTRQPDRVVEPLQRLLANFCCVTEGPIPPLGEQAIDHIALSRDLNARDVQALDNSFGEPELSDHFGLKADLVDMPWAESTRLRGPMGTAVEGLMGRLEMPRKAPISERLES